MNYTNKGLLKINKNVINAAVINRVNKAPYNFKTVTLTWIKSRAKKGASLPITSWVTFISADFFYFADKGRSTRSLLLPEVTSRFVPSQLGCFVPKLIRYVLYVKYL